WAGVVTAMLVFVITPTVAAAPPKLTLAPGLKLLPLIVTAVPPTAGPVAGETPESLGGGAALSFPVSAAVNTVAATCFSFSVASSLNKPTNAPKAANANV